VQKVGLGKFIVEELEKITKGKGINRLYLLTTTAEDFFTKLGYKIIDRKELPIEIKNTTEFTSVCPSTASVLRKLLL
jgi:amino-acid N-acetyltransferase